MRIPKVVIIIIIALFGLFAAGWFFYQKIAPNLWRLPLTPLHKNQILDSWTSDLCDGSLSKHVYTPDRLEVLKDCLSLRGQVDHIQAEPDGDYHILLKPVSEQSPVLNFFNRLLAKGDLVAEVICQGKVEDGDASKACQGITKGFNLPQIGDKVEITGRMVVDKTYGWIEIHPVSKVEIEK